MPKPRGFTLIELLIVMTISAIMIAIASPSLKTLIQTRQINSTVSIFMSDLRFARSESIRRGGGVVMCRSMDPEVLSPVCTDGSDSGWETGWIIFHDLNSNGTKNSNETTIRVQAPFANIDSIAEAGAATTFKFTATGRLSLTSSTSVQFGGEKFTNETQRIVCVSKAGLTRIAGDGFSECK